MKPKNEIKIGVDVIGAAQTAAKIVKVASKLPEQAQVSVLQIAMMFEERAKWYASGNDGGPQVQTGMLRNSITTEEEPDGASVAPHTDYAVYVEFGTSRSKAYPFMRPAFEDRKDEALSKMQKELGKKVSLTFGQEYKL